MYIEIELDKEMKFLLNRKAWNSHIDSETVNAYKVAYTRKYRFIRSIATSVHLFIK